MPVPPDGFGPAPGTRIPEGVHTLKVRAIDKTGATQTDVIQGPVPDGATGYHTRRVKVRAPE